MKTTSKSVLAAIAATFAVSVFAAPPSSISEFVPKLMNYQGYLANPSTGTAYRDGIYDLECRLYRTQSGGSAIWGAKYSVYVKDGYFNIMLGDASGATSLTATYGLDYLWKALWYDTALTAANNNQLWLGVTPLQDANHATISNPKEISPRQQLLSAPFAFRAQSAKYADAAQGDFTVPGNLTVNGSMSLPSTYEIKHVKATPSSLILGYKTGSAQSSGPAITNAASYYGVLSYYDQRYHASNGNISFSTSSAKSFQFNIGAFAVTNGQLISLHNNYSDLEMRANNTKLAGSYTTVSSLNTTTITGNYATIASKYSVTLAPATNSYVYGQGTMRWKSPGLSSYKSPFQIKQMTLTFSSGNNSAYAIVESAPVYYQWVVVGVRTRVYNQPPLCQIFVKRESSGRFTLFGELESNASNELTYYVEVMGISNAFVDDQRNSN